MNPATIVLLSSILTYGAPIAFAVWQIWSLRTRPPGRDDEPPRSNAPKPLPDCLQPRVLLSRAKLRELNDA